jgi:hypothetical protein
MSNVTVLLVSGSTWTDSPQTRALRRLHEMVLPGTTTDLSDGMPDLPAFVPWAGREPVAVRGLLDRIDSADAVVFSHPSTPADCPAPSRTFSAGPREATSVTSPSPDSTSPPSRSSSPPSGEGTT